MHLATYIRIVLQSTVILVSEELGKEVVAILIIVKRTDFKILHSTAPLSCNCLGLRALFGKYPCYGSTAKLEFGFHPKEALRSCDKGAIQWQTHIPQFHLAYYIVLIGRIFQLEDILKVKCRLGVIHRIDREAGTYLPLYAQADTLVKINPIGTAIFRTYRRVIVLGIAQTQIKGNIPLWDNVYIIPPEDRFEKLRLHIELREQIPLGIIGCLSLSGRLHSPTFLPEIQAHTLTHHKALVLLGC